MEVALLNVRITFQKNEVVTDAIGNHKTGGRITIRAMPR